MWSADDDPLFTDNLLEYVDPIDEARSSIRFRVPYWIKGVCTHGRLRVRDMSSRYQLTDSLIFLCPTFRAFQARTIKVVLFRWESVPFRSGSKTIRCTLERPRATTGYQYFATYAICFNSGTNSVYANRALVLNVQCAGRFGIE